MNYAQNCAIIFSLNCILYFLETFFVFFKPISHFLKLIWHFFFKTYFATFVWYYADARWNAIFQWIAIANTQSDTQFLWQSGLYLCWTRARAIFTHFSIWLASLKWKLAARHMNDTFRNSMNRKKNRNGKECIYFIGIDVRWCMFLRHFFSTLILIFYIQFDMMSIHSNFEMFNCWN